MVMKKYLQPALQIIKAEPLRLMSGSGGTGGNSGGSGGNDKDRWVDFNIGIGVGEPKEEVIEGDEITFD